MLRTTEEEEVVVVVDEQVAIDCQGLWRRGRSNQEIAALVSVPIDTVRAIVDGRYRLKKRSPEYQPTPEEIRRECLAIQGEWSPDMREKRQVFKSLLPDFTAPHSRGR